MSSFLYRQQADLVVKAQADGWTNIYLPDDPTGVALDPVLSAIWSAAEGHTLSEVARSTGVPAHLASSTLATLQHAGLLLGKAPAEAKFSGPSNGEAARSSVSLVITHRHMRVDLERCLESVLSQGYPGLLEATAIATVPIAPGIGGLGVVECDAAHLPQTLVSQLTKATAEAILLLDSTVSLVPGSLAELLHALELSGPVAAVAPRVMWRQRPCFVAHLGQWSHSGNTGPDPYAGQLDLGQFRRRWQAVPAVSFRAGLLSKAALQQVGPPEAQSSVDGTGINWCYRARKDGYHILAATRAVAHGPWTDQGTAEQKVQDGLPRNRGEQYGLVPPGTVSTVHEGAPALTLENVRAIYSQCPDITPFPVRRQVALVAEETPRHQGMAQALNAAVDVSWVVPRYSDEATLRQVCETAELVITTIELLEKVAFLQGWHRPVVVDTQPQIRTIQSPHLWPQAIDGLVCASEEEYRHWQSKLATHRQPDSGDLVVLVPTGVEPATQTPDLGPRETLPEIQAGDSIILWCGSWQPFDDPLTAVHAFDSLQSTHNGVKLLFATFEDDEQRKVQEAEKQTTQLVAELGLTHSVLFVRDIPTHLRRSYLAEADLGLVLRTDTLEAKLHEPVALAAAIGAGLPLVMTSASAGSGLVRRYGLGHTVPEGDVSALAQTLVECLKIPRSETRARFEEAWEALAWSQVIAPLASLCQRARFAPDQETNVFLNPGDLASPPPEPTALVALPAKVWETLSGRGVKATLREVSRYIRWKVGM